ncbi:MAG: hypothetical protein OXG27_15440 [Chloroflexi bacterium]|nr:hypothetical protein [Chloroflexota bacterium]
MNDELREPPTGPIWSIPTEFYLARHTSREMTNVVFELRKPLESGESVVVIPLDPDEVLHLAHALTMRLKVVSEYLEEDQAIDDLTW